MQVVLVTLIVVTAVVAALSILIALLRRGRTTWTHIAYRRLVRLRGFFRTKVKILLSKAFGYHAT